MRRTPTALVAAGTLIGGYAVAVQSGSRALGGLVLLVGGFWCIRVWVQRHGVREATALSGVCLAAFVLSHVLALAIGAWPAVLLVAAVVAAVAWVRVDARHSSALSEGARGSTQ